MIITCKEYFKLRIVTDAWKDENGNMIENDGYWYGDSVFQLDTEEDALEVACGIAELSDVDRVLNDGGGYFDLFAGNELRGYFVEVPMMNTEMARRVLEEYKDNTAYFDGLINGAGLKRTLRESGFGVAESNVIVASLVLVGAKFRVG